MCPMSYKFNELLIVSKWSLVGSWLRFTQAIVLQLEVKMLSMPHGTSTVKRSYIGLGLVGSQEHGRSNQNAPSGT